MTQKKFTQYLWFLSFLGGLLWSISTYACLGWVMEGTVTDAISGNPIEGAMVNTNCHDATENATGTETNENGQYLLKNSCTAGTYAITASASGYKTLTCHIPVSQNSKIGKNISLFPEGQNVPFEAISYHNSEDRLIPSKGVYRNGDTLEVEFPLFSLPSDICVLYYLAVAMPDGELFIITDKNQFEAPHVPLPHWKGNRKIVIDIPIDDTIPRGRYALYLLRMPAHIENPINHLELGELNRTIFEVK